MIATSKRSVTGAQTKTKVPYSLAKISKKCLLGHRSQHGTKPGVRALISQNNCESLLQSRSQRGEHKSPSVTGKNAMVFRKVGQAKGFGSSVAGEDLNIQDIYIYTIYIRGV
ncbi:unnamed protein product [Ixodes pacificus]